MSSTRRHRHRRTETRYSVFKSKTPAALPVHVQKRGGDFVKNKPPTRWRGSRARYAKRRILRCVRPRFCFLFRRSVCTAGSRCCCTSGEQRTKRNVRTMQPARCVFAAIDRPKPPAVFIRFLRLSRTCNFNVSNHVGLTSPSPFVRVCVCSNALRREFAVTDSVPLVRRRRKQGEGREPTTVLCRYCFAGTRTNSKTLESLFV